ncbi:O-antigen ligase family protein [Meiothermus sp. CFH 77666]|uniref:O-antigen ligase family protein n=1 Tax=Meiothermus sp. CFH 77666 TaxID=2817942 RepID=UPI001AA07DA2|nr:O-antigen ligase family protein [Meiothermus sp. CFH 77666]MBO1436010.1 O-antigen ligase family protein [Meiothermus sp. CFH 77666]
MLKLFLLAISALFLGYTLMGKGFAYIGVSPLYVAEGALLLGLILATLNPSILQRALTWPMVLIVPFFTWSLLQTLPYLSNYGLNALRDAAIWGYALFAILIYGVILKNHSSFFILIRYYRYYALFFPLMILPLIATDPLNITLPSLPGTQIPLVVVKFGDIGVHLAGAAIFVLLGLGGNLRWSLLHTPIWVLGATVVFGLTAAANRGGAVSFVMAVLPALASLFPRINARLVGYAVGFLLSFALFGLASMVFLSSVQVVGSRSVSIEQITTNFISIVLPGVSDAGNVEANRRWRLKWWEKIVGYTFFGSYFWTGKGYGINLATSDGFQVDKQESLRSPHNGHLNILARSGVPGLALWLTLLIGWAWAVLRARRLAARNGDHLWAGLFLWLFCYWLAFVVNASFDVFLEGPMGGVPFWLLTGLGFAATVVYANPASRPRLGQALGLESRVA